MDINELNPIYKELQGYLTQTPLPKDPDDFTREKSVWEQYNQTIEILNNTTSEDFSRFKVEPEGSEYPSLNITGYRQKIGGLISHLHAKYYNEEPEPFSGSPTTVITQHQQQNQNQTIHIQLLLDIQSKIEKNIDNYDEGTKEKSFLETLKNQLNTVTTATKLFALILQLANKFGLNPEEILKLLNLS